MSLRLCALSFVITAAAAVAACHSSGPHGAPAHAAIGTGIAVAGAAANRAITGECWAQCLPGTVCNKQSGLCEREARPNASATPVAGTAGHRAPVANASYPPGHVYEVPPAPAADAGCDPTSSSGSSGLTCEMDASLPQ